MRAVILAGGEGKRLRPLTYYFQKCMVPVGKRQLPLLHYVLANIARHGITDFVVLVGYRGEQVRNYFGSGERFGWSITYVEDTEEYSGTGGSLLNAIRIGALSPEEDVLVHYGDILTNLNVSRMVDLHRERSADSVLALSSGYELPVGVARVEGERVVELVEKPRLPLMVTIGVLTLSGRGLALLEGLGPRSDLMRDLIPEMIRRGFVVVPYTVTEFWLDVGSIERYEKMDADEIDRAMSGVVD
ncbi:MAG: nucleotidyltransferase family protein [Aigarchaeota archaeon]|nr:nucleotidyltransferase family protein [Candidatus Calditenuis fumarioli]